jgi:hypothetical protein
MVFKAVLYSSKVLLIIATFKLTKTVTEGRNMNYNLLYCEIAIEKARQKTAIAQEFPPRWNEELLLYFITFNAY